MTQIIDYTDEYFTTDIFNYKEQALLVIKSNPFSYANGDYLEIEAQEYLVQKVMAIPSTFTIIYTLVKVA